LKVISFHFSSGRFGDFNKVFGPTLFLIYVNDIGKSTDLDILSYADDTTLYLINTNVKTLYLKANEELEKLYDWFCSNQLSLNRRGCRGGLRGHLTPLGKI